MKINHTLFILVILFFSISWGTAGFADENRPVHIAKTDAEDAVQSFNGPQDSQDSFENDLFDEYEENTDTTIVSDPLYLFNYAMYVVNDFLYFYAVKPAAQGYKAIVPTIARKGVSNFFHNLMFPVRFVNSLLQGKFLRACDEVGIFVVNSTAGVLGLNPVAQKHLGMRTSDEDLGQTLGYYSIGEGFYLILPVFGPTTLRDTLGDVGDYFITPLNYAEPWELEWGAKTTDKINSTSFRIGDYEALKEASLDPYIAIRNAYIQNRRTRIKE